MISQAAFESLIEGSQPGLQFAGEAIDAGGPSACKLDSPEFLVFKDWLEEHGIQLTAQQIRRRLLDWRYGPIRTLMEELTRKVEEEMRRQMEQSVLRGANPERWEWAPDRMTASVVEHAVLPPTWPEVYADLGRPGFRGHHRCRHEAQTYVVSRKHLYGLSFRVFRAPGCPHVFAQMLHGTATLDELRRHEQEALDARPSPG